MVSTITPPRIYLIHNKDKLTYRQNTARQCAERAFTDHYMALTGNNGYFRAMGTRAPQNSIETDFRPILLELERSGLYPSLSLEIGQKTEQTRLDIKGPAQKRAEILEQIRASLRASSIIGTDTGDAFERVNQILEKGYGLSDTYPGSAQAGNISRYTAQAPSTQNILWELEGAVRKTLPHKISHTVYVDYRDNQAERLQEALTRALDKADETSYSAIDDLELELIRTLQPGEKVDTRAFAQNIYEWGVRGHYNGWPASDVLRAIKTDAKHLFGIDLDDAARRTDTTQFEGHFPTSCWVTEEVPEAERAAASKTLVARHRERQTAGAASAQETAMPIATQEVPQATATEEVIPTAARTSERQWPDIPEHLREWERPQPRGQRLRNFATNLFRRNRTEPTVQTAAAEAAEPVARAARRPVRRILVTAAAGLASLATVVAIQHNPFANETTQNAQGNAVTNTQGSPHTGGNGGQGGGAGSDIIPDVKPPVTTVTLSDELKAIGVTVTPDGHYRVRIENGSNPWDKAGQLVAASDPKLSGGDAKLLTAITADILTEQNKIPDTRDIPAGTPLDITSMVKAEKNAATMDIAGAINEHPPKGFSTETLQKVVKKLATVR